MKLGGVGCAAVAVRFALSTGTHLGAGSLSEVNMPILRVRGAAGPGLSPNGPPSCAGGLRVLYDKRALRDALDQERAAGRTVGLVPTMGALHDGHRALIRGAAGECDVVAVTVFVNPLQFNRAEDLASYPRSLHGDVAVARAAGAGLVFAPSGAEMYGDGTCARVHVAGLADRLEGESRPGHLDGVATVCTKLFGIAGPCRAYFGEKDFQQLALIRRLVHDLDMPVEVVACPTVRHDDGLALSSRNALLGDEERTVAPGLHRALRVGARVVAEGERVPERIAAAVVAEISGEPGWYLDRVDVVDADTLGPPDPHTASIRIMAAAYLGRVRLIDNLGVDL